MDNLSNEDKRRVAGQCNFLLITLFATAAFICGIYGSSVCNFAARSLNFAEGVDSSTVCDQLLLESNAVCDTLVRDHGIGFYAWYGTTTQNIYGETAEVCLSYTQYIPGVGYVTPAFDTKFNSAKALGITANVFGFMAWFTLMLSSCCPLTQQRLKGLSCYFFLATLFQGLTFLLWKSSACSVGFFSAYFPRESENFQEDVSNVVTGVTCGLAIGSKLAVSATVCYFMCMCLIPGAVAPGPVGYPADEAEAAAEGAAAEEAAEEVEAEEGGAAKEEE